jgi:hypothetical protein
MLRRKWAVIVPCAAFLIALTGCGQSAPASDKKDDGDSQTGVTLTPEQTKELGITTAPARSATYRQTVSGYGVVVALDTIAQADADIESAAAAAAQSAAAAARARSLSTGPEAAVSQEVVEVAQSKAAADAAALGLAQRKLQSLFGLNAPWKTPAQRKAIMAKLAGGQAVLVRVTFPLGSLGGLRPDAISIARLGNATQNWTSRTIWEAPADSNLPGSGYYCLLEGSNLAQNEHLNAAVRIGPQSSGVWIPQTAVLVGENNTWVYVEPNPGHFVRVQVDTGKPDNGGLFLDSNAGIAPNEGVVTGAAGLLMAREVNPSAGGGD